MSVSRTEKQIEQVKKHYNSETNCLDIVGEFAFSELVKTFQPAVYSISLHIFGKNKELANDCAQEVFIKVYKSIIAGKIHYPSRFHKWLEVTTKTTAIKLKKREANKSFLLDSATYKQFLERIEQIQSDRELVLELISPLSKKYKEPIEAFLGTGSITDAAKLLGCSQGEATKRIEDSVKKIKQIHKIK